MLLVSNPFLFSTVYGNSAQSSPRQRHTYCTKGIMWWPTVWLAGVTYTVVIFRKKTLVGADTENSRVDETFPRHKIKDPLHFLNTSDAHEPPDDDVRNTFRRSKSFLCLEIKLNCSNKQKNNSSFLIKLNIGLLLHDSAIPLLHVPKRTENVRPNGIHSNTIQTAIHQWVRG